MKDKSEILAAVSVGLETGVITQADLAPFVKVTESAAKTQEAETAMPPVKPDKLSAVDIIFYVAGIVLFAAIMSLIAQGWRTNSAANILLSAGLGAGMWSLAYYLIRSHYQSDIRRGLVNALLLTGSLLLTTGGYIVMNVIVDGYDNINFFPTAVMLLVLGGLHIGFDRLVRRDLIILMGILLGVAAFPALMAGIIRNTGAGLDVYAIITIVSASLLAYSTRVFTRYDQGRHKLHAAFDSFAAFLALGSMYAASFSSVGIIWSALLIAGVIGLFYLSIRAQNRQLLGSASFFLVLTVITVAFKYFSGFGATTSLIVAAFGLLATAATASSINKKYFPKKPTE